MLTEYLCWVLNEVSKYDKMVKNKQTNFTISIFFFFSIQIDATIYVGGLDEKVAETLLWELFLQAGPVGKWRLLVLISYQATRVEILYIIATWCTVCAVCILIDIKVISVGDTLALDSG